MRNARNDRKVARTRIIVALRKLFVMLFNCSSTLRCSNRSNRVHSLVFDISSYHSNHIITCIDVWPWQRLSKNICDECVEGYYKHLPTCLREFVCNPNGTLNQVSARNTARIFRRSETQINARLRCIWSLPLWCMIFWSWGIYHFHHFRK